MRVTATGSSQPSNSVKVAALESGNSDNAHLDSNKATRLDDTSAADVKTAGALKSDQNEPSASAKTESSSKAQSTSQSTFKIPGSPASMALETPVSDHTTATEAGHVTSERGTPSTAIGTKLSHQASGLPSASGFKPYIQFPET